jgi:choline dehydrogenase
MREGVRIAAEMVETQAFAGFRSRPILPDGSVRGGEGLTRFIRQQTQTLYHPTSTCRMGTDEEAVVDDTLRVRGLEGIRVADASIMPSVVNGNTHAATVMIGERAAALIRATA